MKAFSLAQCLYPISDFAAEMQVLRIHALFEYITLITMRHFRRRLCHVCVFLLFPLRSIDMEFRFFILSHLAKFVVEESSSRPIDGDDKARPFLID